MRWRSVCLGAMFVMGAGAASVSAQEGPKKGEGELLAARGDAPKDDADVPGETGALAGDRLMYTTHFYTANEAVIHGYEDGTKVRILDLARGGTIWSGEVGAGETKLIPTGQGVFSFVSEKKASILVGTPSRCAVVGYWVRDQEGSFRSDKLYTQLPGNVSSRTERFILWSWGTTKAKVTNTTTKEVLFEGTLKDGQTFEIPGDKLASMGNHVLDIEGDAKNLSAQVYYDEGYFVPAEDGRASGKKMRTYVGTITNSVNDLQLFSYGIDAKVKVVDLKSQEVLFDGVVKGDTVKTLTLADKYVEITSDYEISAAVSPYEHYKSNYMEHHFAAGQEGMGIDGNVLVTTPGELWVFSYFDKNPVIVTDMNSGKQIWEGTVDRGKPINVNPGHGFYRVRSAKGVSAMGGSGACGAEFSPAGGLFKVDEQMLQVVQQIKAERIQRAKKEGRKATKAELAAPLSPAEVKRVQKTVNDNLDTDFSAEEIEERSKQMSTY